MSAGVAVYGAAQGDITVTGNVAYTFSYSGGTASATGVLDQGSVQTYSTTSALTASEVQFIMVNGTQVYLDSDFTDGTYTTTYGGTRYVYTAVEGDDGSISSVNIVTSSEAQVYNVTSGDDETTTLAIGDTILTDDSGTYTASWTDSEGNTYTTVGTASTIISAISNSGVDLNGTSVTLTQELTGSVTTAGTAGASYIMDANMTTVAEISGDVAELPDGTTLTFTGDGTGTYTSVSSSDGREVVLSGNTLTLAGKEDAVLATKNDDGTWTIADGVDNVTNSTSEPLSFTTADGDTGTLAPGASYNADTNTLVDGDGKSVIANEDGYATSDGQVTGVGENGSVAYDDDGNLVVTGANDETAINGEELPVSGDDNFNATIPSDGNMSVDGISDGASVDISKVDGIGAEDGANIGLTGDGTATVNGDAISVSGDEDGVQVAASADGIESVSDLDAGAAITAPEGTPISTDGSGAFSVNGTPLTVSGDEDGVTFTPNSDGTLGLSGLDNGAMLTSDSDATVAVGDATYAVGPEASLKGTADGVSAYTAADKNFDDALADLGIDSDTPVVRLSDVTATVDEDGNLVYDLSEQEPGVFRLEEREDGQPYSVILPEGGGSTAIVPSDFDGEVNIEGSDGGDTFINQSDDATMNVTPGSGADKVVTGSANDKINLASGGADTLDLGNGGQLENYDPLAADAPAILVENASDQDAILDAVKAGTLELSEDGIEAGNSDVAISNSGDGASEGRKLAKFISEDGESQLYAWNGGSGALSSDGIDQAAVYVGNAAGDGDGGTIDTDNDYADTVVAGAGDVVSGGNGDTVELVNNGSSSKDGAIVAATSSTASKEITINNFHGGFGRGAHGFRGGFTGFSFANGVMKFLAGAAAFLLNGWSDSSAAFMEKGDDEDTSVTSTSSSSVDATNPGNGVLEYKMTGTDGTTTDNVAIANNKTYTVGTEVAAEDIHYLGESATGGTTVDFSNITDSVAVDLSGNVFTDSYDMYQIQNIVGGAGENSLVGADGTANMLTAGTGKTTVYSSAGNDTLVGAGSSADEATFVFVEGLGNDTVKSFDYGAADTNDKVDFMAADLKGAAINSSGNMTVELNSGDNLVLENANNQVIKAQFYGEEMVVELGDDLQYDSAVELYGAVNSGNKLTVGSTVTDSTVSIALNNLNEAGVQFNDVTEIDASSYSGTASLVGGDYQDDTIRGGAGSNSLWGGLGGDDQLVGGSGSNTFFYLLGDGNDTITNAKDGDVVELLGVSIDDIDLDGTISDSSNSAISVKFNNGETLKIQGATTSDLTGVGIKVDGSTWKRGSDGSWKN